ncbi:MAG TPA: hypothetical protein VN458_11380 [Solirubrobacterales bacterium]|nr:hypothetical protein [Solirubrobacterales bacterium]
MVAGHAAPLGAGVHEEAVERVAERVRELADSYEPPSFSKVPDPAAALFLCAIDHRTGYRGRYLVAGIGPFEGSALLWAVGLQAARRRPGVLTAAGLSEVSPERVAELFRIGGETVADPERRAALWRNLAAGLERDHGGDAEALLAACDGRLSGAGGLLELLARYEAYADPLAKKSLLFAKICARRGWLAVHDPENWAVCADNVLMGLALRSGLIHPGAGDEVRATTRAAFGQVARAAGIEPPVLDDLLWELGRGDPDLLGTQGGDLSEPPRDPASAWY